jgi:predicted restriction endonuclease
MYKNNLDHFTGRAEGVGDRPSPILDIEEIRDMGIRDYVCPYFYSRCAFCIIYTCRNLL